jgi:hypothetical protein
MAKHILYSDGRMGRGVAGIKRKTRTEGFGGRNKHY